jgi:hypothetical protein
VSLKRVAIPSPNYSSRGGATVRLIVLHPAQGALTFKALGNYFADPSSQVSSHVGIDDTVGTIGEYVKRDAKAWTAANANPVAVQAELCAFAEWDAAEWDRHAAMLQNCARWIAEEAAKFGLPITKLTSSQAQGTGRGVCQHVDLGAWGGSHWDCGGAFPIDQVLELARGSSPAPPKPKPPPTPPPPPKPSSSAPAFPYPSSDYLGQPSPDPHCHSGCYGGVDHANVTTWQNRMRQRGWTISVDGCYGPQSEQACRSFQAEKHLAVDGLVGPSTWKATWAAPVT